MPIWPVYAPDPNGAEDSAAAMANLTLAGRIFDEARQKGINNRVLSCSFSWRHDGNGDWPERSSFAPLSVNPATPSAEALIEVALRQHL
jgi:hypothetical protein